MENKTENQQTDLYLVRKVLNGDTSAFGVIIKNTKGLVAMIVYKMIQNRSDQEDVAQDIYLKAFHKLSGFKFQSKLSTWIGQIAYNTCLHYLEKNRSILTDDLAGENDHTLIDQPGNESELFVYRKELSGILKIEIDQLSPIYRTLLHLFYQQELSNQEIIQITGLPEGTIKNYLYRARKLLKERLLTNYKKEEL